MDATVKTNVCRFTVCDFRARKPDTQQKQFVVDIYSEIGHKPLAYPTRCHLPSYPIAAQKLVIALGCVGNPPMGLEYRRYLFKAVSGKISNVSFWLRWFGGNHLLPMSNKSTNALVLGSLFDG